MSSTSVEDGLKSDEALMEAHRDTSSSPSENEKEDANGHENEAENSNENQNEKEDESSQEDSVVKPRFSYTKEELIAISKLPCARSRPKFLDHAFNNANGLWNPEKWPGKLGTSEAGNPKASNVATVFKRERLSESHEKETAAKRKSGDPRDRIKEESQDEIVLSPQRRSFGTGCHVTRNEAQRPQREAGFQETREADHVAHRNRNGVRIGSGRIITRDRNSREEWPDRTGSYERDRNFESRSFREDENRKGNRYNRFSDYDSRRTSNARNKYHNQREVRSLENDEPEWFTGGPTSQSEFIELKGFEEADEKERPRPLKGSSSHVEQKADSRSQSRTSSQEDHNCEEKRPKSGMSSTSANASGKCTPVEKLFNSIASASSKEFSSQEFDINEIFKMDNWRVTSFGSESAVATSTSGDSSGSANTEGTSRFAQWFSDKRESSPIDRLFGQATTHYSHNPGQDSQTRFMFDQSYGYAEPPQPAKSEKDDIKDIVNLFQKANINISHIIQQGERLPVDVQKAPLVSDIEASLKGDGQPDSRDNHSREMRQGGIVEVAQIESMGNLGKNHNVETNPHNIMDLLKEEDLYAMNQQFKSFETKVQVKANPDIQPQPGQAMTAQMLSPFTPMSSSQNAAFYDQARVMLPDVPMAQEIPIKAVRQNEIPIEKLQEGSAKNSSANICAFTPTSVIRKIASEKDKETIHRAISSEDKLLSASHNAYFANGISCDQPSGAPLPRPIVKSGNFQSTTSPQPQIPNPFTSLPSANLYHPSDYESLSKLVEQQRLQQAAAMVNQRPASIPPMQPVLPASRSAQGAVGALRNPGVRPSPPPPPTAAAAAAGLKALPTSLPPLTSQNINMPIIRNMVHSAAMNPTMRAGSINPLQFQLLPRGAPTLDPRHLQALAQARGLHPVALQQLVIKAAAAANIQTQAAAAAAAAAAVSVAQAQAQTHGLVQGAGAHAFGQFNALRPSQMSPTRARTGRQETGLQQKANESTEDYQAVHHNVCSSLNGIQARNNPQSPENLTRWFGNEVLNQALPEMPQVPLQKALLLEDIERQ